MLNMGRTLKVIRILVIAFIAGNAMSGAESEAKKSSKESFDLYKYLGVDQYYQTEIKSMNLETYISPMSTIVASEESTTIKNSNNNQPTPQVEFEIPGVSFVLDHCNEVRQNCIHLQMRTRFVWNNETLQCEPIFPWCEFQGFQSHQDCHEYTSQYCH